MAPIIYYIMFYVKIPIYDFATEKDEEAPSPWKQVWLGWGLTLKFSTFIVNKYNLNVRYCLPREKWNFLKSYLSNKDQRWYFDRSFDNYVKCKSKLL